MVERCAFSVCASLMITGALAGDSGTAQLGLTDVVKSDSQIVADFGQTTNAHGKGDLAVTQVMMIEPASNGPGTFMMLPDKAAPLVSADCQASAMSVEKAEALVRAVAREEGFDERFALAISGAESRFDVNALSEKGAFGLMQLMPGTASDLGVNRCAPLENVRGGVRYLKALIRDFGNPVFALAAYNAGPDNVVKHKGVPPFAETVSYVARVLNRYYGAPERPAATVVAASSDAPASNVMAVNAELAKSKAAAAPKWTSGFVMHFN
jgi:Transglycosylase SLT domain